MVVDVSPWHTVTSLGENAFTAASIASGVKTVPHSVSITLTFAPARVAISVSNWPKRPNEHTSTRSPVSMADAITVSMPLRAVPSTMKVQSFLVSNT